MRRTGVRRVLLTADTIGGVWTYALELARVLGERGVAVDLATMGAPLTPAQRRAATALPRTTVHASGFRLEWMDDPWDDLRRASQWLLQLASATRPDVVHLNQYAFGALDWPAPVLVVGHSCVLSWWEAVHGTAAPATWDRYRSTVSTGLDGADLVAAPSAAMLEALRFHYRFETPGVVIENGRDPSRFAPAPKQDVVLGLGRLWDEAKNVATLARAAPAVPWPVRVAGDATSPDGTRRPLRAVEPLGFLDEPALAAVVGRAALVALPARYEPFGLAALEAAQAGCALVLGDIPSQRELWGGAAAFVPPNDAAALARTLSALIADPARRTALARRARRRALRRTHERMGGSYLDVYERLLARGHTTSIREAVACVS